MADPRWKLPDGFDDDVRKALRNLLFALRNAYKAIPSTAWEQLRLGNIQAFMDLIDWSSFKGDLSEFQDILRDAAKRAGDEVLTDGDIVLDYAFDLVDARAVDFAYNRSSQLITVITEEAKANIRQIIGDATNGQMTYFQAGQRIRSHIGLTERDAGAVDKFRNRTFERLMRDGLSEAKAREKAEEKAAKYADKLLRRRAETISRTELADAASTGRFNGWQTGVEQGLIDNASVKEWLAEPNACPICSGFAGKKIPWNSEFAEGIKMSPAHPNCRCRVVILPPDYAEEVYTTKKAIGWTSVVKHLSGKHDQSSHGKGNSKATPIAVADIPEEAHYRHNLVSATAPHIGLSPKAQEVATRIGPTTRLGTDDNFVARAVYTDKQGRQYNLELQQNITRSPYVRATTPDEMKLEVTGEVTWQPFVKEQEFDKPKFLTRDEAVNALKYSGDGLSTKTFVPATIDSVHVSSNYGRRDIATAMLEFARRESGDVALLHSYLLTGEGERWADMTKHLAGKHDQSTHAGGSTARPYALTPAEQLTKPLYTGTKENYADYATYWSGYNTELNVARNLAISGVVKYSSPESTASTDSGQRFQNRLDELEAERAANNQVIREITNDPNYPFASKEHYYLSEAEQLAHTKVENAFVLEKLRGMPTADGRTVGEVMDAAANNALKQLKDITINEDVSVTMPDSRLKRLIADERYKTVYEVSSPAKSSARSEYLDRRQAVETNKIGVPENVSATERPVYGVFGETGYSYGDAKIVLKDSVKHRTTLTVGDSMDGNSAKALWASDIAEGKVSTKDFLNASAGTFQDSSYVYGRKTSVPIGAKPIRSEARHGYIEAQIHNGIKLSDIARIEVPASYTFTKKEQNKLEDLGIEVVVNPNA